MANTQSPARVPVTISFDPGDSAIVLFDGTEVRTFWSSYEHGDSNGRCMHTLERAAWVARLRTLADMLETGPVELPF